jgi:hypothetical protein
MTSVLITRETAISAHIARGEITREDRLKPEAIKEVADDRQRADHAGGKLELLVFGHRRHCSVR